MIFHILPKNEYDLALGRGFYYADSLDSEGFIHFSTADQVDRTAKRFYKGVEGLVLIKVDPNLVTSELKYEPADGEDFPHLYGKLNTDAIVEVYDLSWQGDDLVRTCQ